MHQIKDKRLSEKKERKKKDPTAWCFQKTHFKLHNGKWNNL